VNLRQALENAREALRDKEIEDASLEGEILLRYVLGLSRARLFSQLEGQIDAEHEKDLKKSLERRLSGEPTAYIIGIREFYGLNFIVDRRVLIPRPESELLVEKAIELAGKRKIATIADIGTGSGAIAVSLAVNLPGVTIYAIDISAPALEVAAKNCQTHKVADKVVLLKGDMLEPLPGPVDMIIANLPYVKTSDLTAQRTLDFEPPLALHGGVDGLDIIRVFCNQAGEKLNPDGCLLMEIGQGQAERVTALLRKAFPSALIEIKRDLAGIERMVSLWLTQGRKF
jgi:release factor glutamine methyltransferase